MVQPWECQSSRACLIYYVIHWEQMHVPALVDCKDLSRMFHNLGRRQEVTIAVSKMPSNCP